MECGPTARKAVVREAMPEEPRVAAPRLVAPSRNVTVPVGVPPGELTVAVKVTACPNTAGLAEEIDVTVVEAIFTVCDNGDEVLALKFVSPP